MGDVSCMHARRIEQELLEKDLSWAVHHCTFLSSSCTSSAAQYHGYECAFAITVFYPQGFLQFFAVAELGCAMLPQAPPLLPLQVADFNFDRFNDIILTTRDGYYGYVQVACCAGTRAIAFASSRLCSHGQHSACC